MEKDRHPFLSVYRWFNTLSLDVCLGAMAGGIMATQLLETRTGWSYWIILAMAVWLIYTADHLIDGYRTGSRKAHYRHGYHRKNFNQLILISILIIISAAIIAFSFLPENVILFGVILGVLSMIYLALVLVLPKVRMVFFPKELLVALFYTAGIWGPVIILNNGLEIDHVPILLIFFLLAFEDLIMLSMVEIKTDKMAGQGSFPIYLGYRNTMTLFYAIAVIVIVLALMVFIVYPDDLFQKAALLLALMQAGLIIIFRFSPSLSNKDIYRYLSEAIFFIPALMLL